MTIYELPVNDQRVIDDAAPEVSRLANSIGYALAKRGVALTADDTIAAAQRAIDQGWRGRHPGPDRLITEGVPVKPSVGRIVHYVSYGTPGGEYTRECRAAIVTEVINPDLVGLAVLNPTGMFFNREITHDESGTVGGTWHWPER